MKPWRPVQGRAAGSPREELEVLDFLMCRAYDEFFPQNHPARLFASKIKKKKKKKFKTGGGRLARGLQAPRVCLRAAGRASPPQVAEAPRRPRAAAAARSLSAGATWRPGASAGLPAGYRSRQDDALEPRTGGGPRCWWNRSLGSSYSCARFLWAARGVGLFALVNFPY